MKLRPIHHPVLGHLAPDQWGDSLMCFRAILGLKMFVSEYAPKVLSQLDSKDRQLVESWPNATEALVKKCRHNEIFDGLRGLGVFEVGFSKTATGEPSAEQVTGYQYFQEHQARICQNIANAMLRYYPIARSIDEDWFDNNDCPEVSTLEELGPLATLDGITYTNTVCEGLPVLTLGWKINWDEEHGLSMAVWKDQVIGIGFEDLYDLPDSDASDYLIWTRTNMTPAEREALDRVVACLGEYEEDDEDDCGDDEDDDFDDEDE